MSASQAVFGADLGVAGSAVASQSARSHDVNDDNGNSAPTSWPCVATFAAEC